ncbi:hypothetical protein AMS68_004801 [Peltaster fructicola]|uniref:Uncharacterized protein n=1 Tax=Peltaster fructicola TaxID=286661 RepID=A0A6H0XX27_9PEZI|nr:hypothetical protein AMS68_004801 [Peltaster fructicola]
MTAIDEKHYEAQLSGAVPSEQQEIREPEEKEFNTDPKDFTDTDTSDDSRIASGQDAVEKEMQAQGNDNAKAERPQRPALMRHYTKLANKEAHPWQHWGITLGLPMIVLFDIIVPIIIYYSWYNSQQASWANQCQSYWSSSQPCPVEQPPEFNSKILGSAVASFGIGELWILLARVYRLFVQREQCAPLLSRNRWELDATSWVYLVAMICALIPFVVGGALEIPHLYLYGPAFLFSFLGVLMLVTTFIPFKTPVGINSTPRGQWLRPFIFFAAEDFIAVDGLQDREFRVKFIARYDDSASFRRFFFNLTLLWEFGVLVYLGCVSAVIWTLPFHIAFGLSLGVLFAFIATFAGITYVWVLIEMKRERLAYEREGLV